MCLKWHEKVLDHSFIVIVYLHFKLLIWLLTKKKLKFSFFRDPRLRSANGVGGGGLLLKQFKSPFPIICPLNSNVDTTLFLQPIPSFDILPPHRILNINKLEATWHDDICVCLHHDSKKKHKKTTKNNKKTTKTWPSACSDCLRVQQRNSNYII